MAGTPPRVTLEIGTGGTARAVDLTGRSIVIGRDTGADVVVADSLVSRRHLEVRGVPEGIELRDLGSTNGSWLDGSRLLVATVAYGEVAELRLGDPAGVNLSLRSTHAALSATRGRQEPPPAARSAQRTLTVGRSPNCDIVVADPLVSREHFRIDGDREVVIDLDSHNGTLIDGEPLVGSAPLRKGARIDAGNLTFRWTGGGVERLQEDSPLVVKDLVLTTKGGKALLSGVSATFPANSLTAVIGPSGAGKSTLLATLTGNRPADHGQVLWRGQNLYANYESLRFHIGLVPQQDIGHPQLRVRAALKYAARLRLPPDTTDAEVTARVDGVLDQMQLTAQADQQIGATLSGGQRKRVSIAMELLTAPPLLFLDEPTSGLDPALDRDVMVRLRALADEGRIVLTVTHSVQALELCDRVLVLAPGGSVAYFGPPDRMLAYFDAADHVGVFSKLDSARWAEAFVSSSLHAAFVASPAERGGRPEPVATTRRPSTLRQAATIARRTCAVAAADRMFLALLVLMPLILAALAHVVSGDTGLAYAGDDSSSAETSQRLTILIVGACLMGTALTIRELVRERPILQREHAVGLSLGGFWLAKSAVFASLAFVQGITFVWLAKVGLPGPADGGVLGSGTWEVALPIGLATASMAVIGLSASAVVKSSEQAMPALVGIVMVQLVLSGALVPLAGRVLLEQLAWLSPARWAYAAAAVSTHLGDRPPTQSPNDRLYARDPQQWIGDTAMVLVLLAAYAVVGYVVLRRTMMRSKA